MASQVASPGGTDDGNGGVVLTESIDSDLAVVRNNAPASTYDFNIGAVNKAWEFYWTLRVTSANEFNPVGPVENLLVVEISSAITGGAWLIGFFSDFIYNTNAGAPYGNYLNTKVNHSYRAVITSDSTLDIYVDNVLYANFGTGQISGFDAYDFSVSGTSAGVYSSQSYAYPVTISEPVIANSGFCSFCGSANSRGNS